MARPPSGPMDGDFTEFVQASCPGVYRTAYLLVGERTLAKDLAQTALVKPYAALRQLRVLALAVPGPHFSGSKCGWLTP